MISIRVELYQDTRHKNKTGLFPVYVRVYHQRRYKLLNTHIVFTPQQFDALFAKKPASDIKDVKKMLQTYLRSIELQVSNMKPFGLDLIHETWDKPTKLLQPRQPIIRMDEDIMHDFETVILELNRAGRLGTENSYKNSLNKLKQFSSKQQLSYREVTPAYLEAWENWMIDVCKNSISTVGIYARIIRTLFNRAIMEERIDRKIYPFGYRRYTIPAARNIKKALSLEEIGKIFRYTTSNMLEQRAIDFWKFSYLANGMNVKDIAQLRNKDYYPEENLLSYIRAKTKRSRKANLTRIVVYVGPQLQLLIEKWRNTAREPEDYLFLILERGMNAKQQRNAVQNYAKFINKYMKRAAKVLGITKPVSTYSARHSFSTVLMKSGANLKYISEALGHSSLKTTESYLGGIDDGTRQQLSNKLTDFGDQQDDAPE